VRKRVRKRHNLVDDATPLDSTRASYRQPQPLERRR
jgi:hypothetical protein